MIERDPLLMQLRPLQCSRLQTEYRPHATMSLVPPLRTINVTRYVTPLREGGSLPAIVEVDDDGLYASPVRLLIPSGRHRHHSQGGLIDKIAG